MYKTVSFRGIQPVYTPVVWQLNVPPKIHIFLWLMANNKTLTRSNLAKRQKVDDISCLFCTETETVSHLFFECCVSTAMWSHLSKIFNKNLGSDFESVARWWTSNKKNAILNSCCAALTWCIWTTRNDFCFQGMTWKSEKDLMLKLIRTLKNWRAVCKNVNLQDFDHVVEELTTSLHQPLCIAWDGPTATFSSSQTGLQSGLAPSTGQEAWNDTTTPSTPEETPNESSSSHRYVP